MPFISNFDFSYPKCHVLESHCRYQRIQSRWLLGWYFFIRFFSICLCNKRIQWKEKSSSDCSFLFLQHNKLGLNRVEGDRVTQQLVSAHPLQHAEKYSAFFYASLHKLFRLLVMTSSFSCTIFSDVVCSLFRMVAHNLYAVRACRLYLFNLRDWLRLIFDYGRDAGALCPRFAEMKFQSLFCLFLIFTKWQLQCRQIVW